MERGGLARDLRAALARSKPAPGPLTATRRAPGPVPAPLVAAVPAPTPDAAAQDSLAGAVLFADEMRLGLHGQTRRVWAPVGEAVEQVLQIVYRWTYLLLGVDPLGGRLVWEWVTHMRGAVLAPAMAAWKARGAAAVVLDNAPGHHNPALKASAPPLVPLPPYSPELDPAERVFRWIRPQIEGEIYDSLDAKRERVEALLRELAADPDRVRSLTAWSWLVPQVKEGIAAEKAS